MQWDQHIFHPTYSWTVWKDESQVWVLDILYPPKIQECHLKRDHFTLFHKENNLPTSIFQGQTPKFSWGLDVVCVLCTIRMGQLLHLDCLAYCMKTTVFQQLAHYLRMNPTRFVLSGLNLLHFIACFTSLPIYLSILFPTSLVCASRNKNPWFFAFDRRSS